MPSFHQTMPSLVWSEVETVLLDLDGTLLDLQFDNTFWHELVPRAYAQKEGIPLGEAKAKLFGWYRTYRGQLAWYCLDHWSELLGLELAELKRRVRHGVRLLPHARRFLEGLLRHRKRLYLVTNAHPKTLEIKLQQVDLRPYFEKIVTSHHLGAAKETGAFWRRLAEEIPYLPERTLMVDDSLPVLEAAREAGVRYLVAVRQPSSSAPPQETAPFPALEDLEPLPSRS